MTTFSKPTVIEGKWNKRQYVVQKELGQGANGTVYLVLYQGQPFAVKMGEDSFSITSEVNVLKEFQKAQGGILGPSVFDVDDWEQSGAVRPFYVMNVIEGHSLEAFIRHRGQEWLPVLMIQLLGFLDELHRNGWIFGDLKLDNLRVSGHPPRMAWFDAGGVTKIGRSIKEYTEWFDRGFWQMGTRKAEPSYDLFSVAMIMIALSGCSAIQPTSKPERQLREIIDSQSALYPYRFVLWKALKGEFQAASQMRQELITAWQRSKSEVRPEKKLEIKKKKKSGSMISTLLSFFLFTSFFLLLLALYLVSQTYM